MPNQTAFEFAGEGLVFERFGPELFLGVAAGKAGWGEGYVGLLGSFLGL
jgi:hypothetical protein